MNKISLNTFGKTMLDILFFRRLFNTNKFLWAASWTFHLSLLLVILRHSRYIAFPVPEFIVFMQPAGIIAGYILPFSLLLILLIRMSGGKERYISFYNLYIIIVLLSASVTGLLMKTVFRVNLVDVKAFILGLTFLPGEALPDSTLFIVHYSLFLILLPALPFHLVASPVITWEARMRDERLHMVLHEK